MILLFSSVFTWNNQSNFTDAALKTAMWWSEKVFRTPMNQNNGDNTQQGGLTFLLQNGPAYKRQAHKLGI